MATRRLLNQLTERLNKRLDRPQAAWTRQKDKTLKANPGHLFLDHNSAYGGYRLTEMHNEGGGECGFNDGGISPRMSNPAICAYLRGIHDALDVTDFNANE